MSLLTIEQVLCDSEKLAARLQEDDNTADDLLSQARCVYKQIDAMKQYSEETMELNELARQRPHPVLVAGIQQESRHLRELQQENRELRAALEDHQNALEVIMSKYRQHVTHLVQASRPPATPHQLLNNQYAQLKRQSDKINEMAAVMRMAAQTDEKDSLQDIEVISKLATENQGLRELLNISVKYGSYKEGEQPAKSAADEEDAQEADDSENRISCDESKTSDESSDSSPEQTIVQLSQDEQSPEVTQSPSQSVSQSPPKSSESSKKQSPPKSSESSKKQSPPKSSESSKKQSSAADKDETFWS